MSLDVDVDDIEACRQKIQRDIELVRGTEGEIMEESRQETEWLAQEETPIGEIAGPEKYPGQLWDAISSRISGQDVIVEPDEMVAPYASNVITGTEPSPGRYVPGIGRIKEGMHPGTPANPFMSRAADRLTSGKLGEIIRRIIRKIRL